MKARKYVVRVTNDSLGPIDNTPFIECLRYAGLVAVHAESAQVFDILPPAHIANTESRSWALANAQRMQSFGYNAVMAPEWAR